MKNKITLLMATLLIIGCNTSHSASNEPATISTTLENTKYKGTASVTQGIATTIMEDIYTCQRGRKMDVGKIISTDGKKWVVPAQTNYSNNDFPFAPDLFNACEGHNYGDI